jgi:hypothetical protein
MVPYNPIERALPEAFKYVSGSVANSPRTPALLSHFLKPVILFCLIKCDLRRLCCPYDRSPFWIQAAHSLLMTEVGAHGRRY